MKPLIFEYSSYREYLKDRLEYLGQKSGLKRRAAEHLAVHTTFISQVVLGKAELSLDQAERMNTFLQHGEDEGEFFLDLLIHDRAGEEALRKRYAARIKRKQTERSQIQQHLEKTKTLLEQDQARFYSSHIYGLIHVLSSIPKFRSISAMAGAIGVSVTVVEDAVEFLLRVGLLKRVKDQLVPGEIHVHLGRESAQIRQHHANWRLATLQQMAWGTQTDLHYSLVFSCSEQDAIKIRESLLAHLKTLTKKIEASKEESAYVYCLDFFNWA